MKKIKLIAFLFFLGLAAQSQTPFGGTARPIPGQVEAEDYDNGGQNVAYYDTDLGNTGGAYRTDDVDIGPCGEGGYDLGWTYPGEWLIYTVDVATAGTYTLQARVASGYGNRTFHIEMDGTNISGTINVPTTDWQVYSTVTVTTPALTAGQKKMKIVIETGQLNINYINFTLASATPPAGGSYLPISGGNITGSLLIGNVAGLQHQNSAYILNVAGPARAYQLTVNTTGADFVFRPSYRLRPLSEVESYVRQNQHLPGVAPATEMRRNGVEVGEYQTRLLQKIEELTLYAIRQDKKQEGQQKLIAEQSKILLRLRKRLDKLEQGTKKSK